MTKCVICDERPARSEGTCNNCSLKLKAEYRRKAKVEAKHFLTYKGHVVGLFPNGDGMLSARLLRRSAEKLPKRKTLDLNTYIEGFNRDQIKRFKACVLRLANA